MSAINVGGRWALNLPKPPNRILVSGDTFDWLKGRDILPLVPALDRSTLYGVPVVVSENAPPGQMIIGPDARGGFTIVDLDNGYLAARRYIRTVFANTRKAIARDCPLTCPPEWLA